eukprot:30957-Pelagococcus_subviridis.AAC.56
MPPLTAIPTSAATRAGASLMPSPTIATLAPSLLSRLPTNTRRPSTIADAPRPGDVSASTALGRGDDELEPSPAAAAATAAANGCVVLASTAAASRIASPMSITAPDAAATPVTRGRPSVIVPVLSKATVSIPAAASRTSPPRSSSPNLAPADVATSTAVGVASPSAQGHATTSTSVASFSAPRADPAPPEASNSAPGKYARRARGHDAVHERTRDRVREALNRRGASLRVRDRARDSRGDAAVPRGARPHRERTFKDARPRGDAVARRLRHEQRLPRERRLVNGRGAGDDFAVHGYHLPREHPNEIPRAQREAVDDHGHRIAVRVLVELVRDHELRVQGKQRRERSQIGRRSSARARFERPAEQDERQQQHGFFEEIVTDRYPVVPDDGRSERARDR